MKINKYFVQETIESLLSQLGYFYIPTKANKKRVCDFFNRYRSFFDLPIQNKLYDIIHIRPLKSYIDSNETWRILYYIYMTLVEYIKWIINFTEFYEHFKQQLYSETIKYKKWKKNNIHTYIFIVVFFVFLVLLVCRKQIWIINYHI